MGWTEYAAKHHKNGKVDRKSECDSLINCDKLEVLKSAMVGSIYYAAVKQRDDDYVFAAVILTSVNNKDYFDFAYKDMDETCGPRECKCPKAILNLLTETDSEFAKNWRVRCWEYHNSQNNKSSLGSLKVGSIVEFTARGITYKATKTYGCAYLINDSKETKLKKINTYWKLDNPNYKASSKCINSWGYTVIHSASKEEELKLRAQKISEIKF